MSERRADSVDRLSREQLQALENELDGVYLEAAGGCARVEYGSIFRALIGARVEIERLKERAMAQYERAEAALGRSVDSSDTCWCGTMENQGGWDGSCKRHDPHPPKLPSEDEERRAFEVKLDALWSATCDLAIRQEQDRDPNRDPFEHKFKPTESVLQDRLKATRNAVIEAFKARAR